MTPQQRAERRERRWGQVNSAKVLFGGVLAVMVAPYVVIVADRARVYRNTIRLGRRA